MPHSHHDCCQKEEAETVCWLLPAVHPARQVAVLYLPLIASDLSVVLAGNEGNLGLCCSRQAMESLERGQDQPIVKRYEKLRLALW